MRSELVLARVPAANGTSTLSLYITSLVVDFSQNNYEMSATMMAAIKAQDDKAGERGARADFVWEVWENNWIFRQESEVWGTRLNSPICTQHSQASHRMSLASTVHFNGEF